MNEESFIDILSQTPRIAHCLNFVNDAEITKKRKTSLRWEYYHDVMSTVYFSNHKIYHHDHHHHNKHNIITIQYNNSNHMLNSNNNNNYRG